MYGRPQRGAQDQLDRITRSEERVRIRNKFLYDNLAGMSQDQLKAVFMMISSILGEDDVELRPQLAYFGGWVTSRIEQSDTGYILGVSDLFPELLAEEHQEIVDDLMDDDGEPEDDLLDTHSGGNYV